MKNLVVIIIVTIAMVGFVTPNANAMKVRCSDAQPQAVRAIAPTYISTYTSNGHRIKPSKQQQLKNKRMQQQRTASIQPKVYAPQPASARTSRYKVCID